MIDNINMICISSRHVDDDRTDSDVLWDGCCVVQTLPLRCVIIQVYDSHQNSSCSRERGAPPVRRHSNQRVECLSLKVDAPLHCDVTTKPINLKVNKMVITQQTVEDIPIRSCVFVDCSNCFNQTTSVLTRWIFIHGDRIQWWGKPRPVSISIQQLNFYSY